MNKELLKNLKILYVEDQEDINIFTSDILNSFVKELISASNGEEGLNAFKENQDIDLIITDINMPKLNGLEMYKKISKIKKDVPVIITSAHTDSSFYQEAISLNISSYTLKPIDLYDLMNNIFKLLEKKYFENSLLSNDLKVEEEIEKYAHSIAFFEDDKLKYGNKSFKDTFNSNFDLTKLDIEDNYLYAKKDENIYTWLKRVDKLSELEKVIKYKEETNKNTYKIDVVFNENQNSYFLLLLNITNLHDKATLFEYKANHDVITGLYNETKFSKLLNSEAKRAIRHRKDLSFFLLDFKSKNKTNDDLLKNISQNILNNLREHDLCFKYEEFKFLVMLPESDLDGALNTSYKLEETLQNLHKEDKCSFYFGVTEYKVNDEKELIISRLEKALEESKNTKQRVNYF